MYVAVRKHLGIGSSLFCVFLNSGRQETRTFTCWCLLTSWMLISGYSSVAEKQPRRDLHLPACAWCLHGWPAGSRTAPAALRHGSSPGAPVQHPWQGGSCPAPVPAVSRAHMYCCSGVGSLRLWWAHSGTDSGEGRNTFLQTEVRAGESAPQVPLSNCWLWWDLSSEKHMLEIECHVLGMAAFVDEWKEDGKAGVYKNLIRSTSSTAGNTCLGFSVRPA